MHNSELSELTAGETRYCADIADRLTRACTLLEGRQLSEPVQPITLYAFLASLKQIQGNVNNDISFVATLLAKEYLTSKFEIDFDAAAKPQGAPGIDIDVMTADGARIVAELKTTVPYQRTDFGAQQAASFKKDFAKLASATAPHKFLFVTEPSAFAVLKKPKYLKLIPSVRLVLLPTGEEHIDTVKTDADSFR